MILTLFEVVKDGQGHNELLSMVKASPLGISAPLLVLAGAIIWVLSSMVYELENAADRHGGYLAVFHDQNISSLPDWKRNLGWHMWNRIEKHAPRQQDETSTAPARVYFIQKKLSIYIWVLLFYSFILFGALSMVTGRPEWVSLGLGLVTCVIVAFRLHVLQQKAKERPQVWNRRWATIQLLDEREVNKALLSAGVRK